ncbi:MAG TPA: hypothetical protein VMT30_02775 [Candidatus Saccharimonadia bacterium]|nr:hypothetical protein [Candidatus Saccharimonadia bacterium]
MTNIVINNYYQIDPDIRAQLDRIETALTTVEGDVIDMTKVTDAAIAKMTDAVTADTNAVTSLEAFLVANAQAVKDLADELTAEGNDAARITALADAQIANSQRIAALILANTPVDPGVVPAPVPTP